MCIRTSPGHCEMILRAHKGRGIAARPIWHGRAGLQNRVVGLPPALCYPAVVSLVEDSGGVVTHHPAVSTGLPSPGEKE